VDEGFNIFKGLRTGCNGN